MTAQLVALGLTLLALGACLLPLFAVEPAAQEADSRAPLVAERERLVTALRDLEMDHAMGRLSDPEHDAARAAMEAEALAVMARLKEHSAQPAAPAAADAEQGGGAADDRP